MALSVCKSGTLESSSGTFSYSKMKTKILMIVLAISYINIVYTIRLYSIVVKSCYYICFG